MSGTRPGSVTMYESNWEKSIGNTLTRTQVCGITFGARPALSSGGINCLVLMRCRR